jgi:hypothetical protein
VPPRARKAALTAHVACSVGWLGSVLAFLGLALVGLAAGDAATVGAVYIALDPLARFVLLPLGLASLATGVIQGLGTPWGLIRHHWVLAKLAITLAATALLALHLSPIERAADIARSEPFGTSNLGGLRGQLVLYPALAAAALLAATAVSVFKPAAPTRWDRGIRGGGASRRRAPTRG